MARPPLTWQINWPLTALAVLLLPTLVSLGFWQLSRAEEKREAMAAFEQLRMEAARPLSQLDDAAPDYTNAQVRGEFDNARTLLIDNRVLKGRFGYEVVSPLHIAGSERWVLVNRGWIEGDPSRRTLPEVPSLAGEIELRGHLYRDRAGFELTGGEMGRGWPRVVPYLDYDQLRGELGVQLAPYSLRLDADSNGALTVAWQIVNQGPQQHVGYAVQWFAMSVALVLAWLFASSNLWRVMRGAPTAAPDGGESGDN
jgi:cytochrome oxidase assembly protein ShyY1